MLTSLLALGFVILLALEWRRRSRPLRIVATVLAVGVAAFAQECLYCALRGAMDTPPASRDTLWSPGGRRLSEYETGAKTMYRQARISREFHMPAQTVALGALVWLALGPALRAGGARQRTAAMGGDASERTAGAQIPPAA